MLNATLDTLNRKTAQLESLIAAISAGALEELCETDRGNFVCVMSDLMFDIRSALNSGTEARHVA